MSGLVKAKKYDISDSNIALLGSDLEKNVRLNAAQKEDAWKNAGKALGVEVWRIEKFQVVAWPKEKYGEFFSGDSYIILRTYKKTPDDQKFSFDVHFWLGRETSQDEAGTAAYKTVELDDFLGGAPVQHREVQGYESDLFLSYFPNMRVQEGGVDSGFKHVKPEEYRARLLHVKGVRNHIVIREVPKTFKSLNSGDVFVLDAGLQLFHFNGTGSNGMERNKAAELVRAISEERKGLAKVTVLTEGDADMIKFWEALGDKGDIKSAAEGGDDSKAEAFEKRLFRLSDSTGKMEFKEEAKGKVKRSHFDTNDVFVFDTGMEVIVWLGKKATSDEKRLGLQYAQNYLHQFNRPPHMPISRVLEGFESESFAMALDSEDGSAPLKKTGAAAAHVPASASAPTAQHK